MLESFYNITCELKKGTAVYNAYSGEIIFIPGFRKPLNQILLSSELGEKLITGGFLVEDVETQCEAAFNRFYSTVNDQKKLYLTVLASLDCNLQCIYCYEEHSRKSLNHRFGRDLLNYVSRRSLDELHICWFGGEPLIAYNVFWPLSTAIRKFSSKAGILYKSKIITNGTLLTPERFSSLLQAGVNSFQVTLDGFQSENDKYRISRNCCSSFEKIIFNLSAIKEIPGEFHISVRVNVDRNNRNIMESFFDFLLNNFEDSRFQFYGKPIRPGKRYGEGFCYKQEEWLIEYPRIMKGRSVRILEGLPKPKSFHCQAQLRNYLILSADRNIYKCDVLLEPSRSVGIFTSEGPVIVNSHIYKWYGIPDFGKECTTCKLLPLCNGGCRKLRSECANPCPFDLQYIKKCIENHCHDHRLMMV